MISKSAYETKKQGLIKELSSVGNQKLALSKSTSNLFRHRKQGNMKRLDVKNFNNVISVDKKNQVVEVEGMTTYETLVEETLKFGLMPTVVPQLKTITIGGAATGIGIESSSFKFGLVHETILEMEILLGNGKTVVCNKNKNSDLFYGFPNSYGTLGYALKLKVKLIPVKKYVKIRHLSYTDSKKYFKDIEKFCKEKEVDFIDGTVFSNKEMYITLGEFTNKVPHTSDYTFMKIYYKSIRKKKSDFLKVKDYIWRWDTDWFWCSKHFYVQNPVVRLFFGRKNLKSKTYFNIRKKVAQSKVLKNTIHFSKKESVVQDVEIPIKNCPKFLDFFCKNIGIKPIWVCPLATYNKKAKFDLYPMDSEKIYVNFGFWDMIKSTHEKGYYNKMIEKKVRALDGKKSLYSEAFYSRKEFWGLYNQKTYNKLKKKYDPNHSFLDLYEKCVLGK